MTHTMPIVNTLPMPAVAALHIDAARVKLIDAFVALAGEVALYEGLAERAILLRACSDLILAASTLRKTSTALADLPTAASGPQ